MSGVYGHIRPYCRKLPRLIGIWRLVSYAVVKILLGCVWSKDFLEEKEKQRKRLMDSMIQT